MSTQPIGVVFDCMVYVQAVANTKGPAARLLDLLDTGEIILFVSRETLSEIRDTMNDEEVRAKLPGITDIRVEVLFRRLERKATTIKLIPRSFEYPRDPKDEPYINLALAAKANYLISRDHDLLDLMDWEREEGREFQKRYRFLKIVTPETFLREIKEKRTY